MGYCGLLQVIVGCCELLQFVRAYCGSLRVNAGYCGIWELIGGDTHLFLLDPPGAPQCSFEAWGPVAPAASGGGYGDPLQIPTVPVPESCTGLGCSSWF